MVEHLSTKCKAMSSVLSYERKKCLVAVVVLVVFVVGGGGAYGGGGVCVCM